MVLWVAFLAMTLAVSGFAKDKSVKSVWAETPVQLDGTDTEWTSITLQNEKKTAVDYAFQNDGANMYVFFRFNDPKFLSSVQITGITIWFNAEGKKKKDLGVNFAQKQMSAEDYIVYLEKTLGALDEAKKAEIRKNPAYFVPVAEFVGKKAESVQGPAGQFMARTQETTITFEFQIPVTVLKANASKPMKLGFQWGGVTDAMKEEWMRSGTIGGRGVSGGGLNDGAGGGRGGGGGGVSGAGFSGGRGSGLTALKKRFKEYDFWLDLQLAQE